MLKFALIALALLSLVGCMSREERIAAQDARDDQTCLSYGAKTGTDAYIGCRTNLATNRNTASAIRGTAPPSCTQVLNVINCN